MCLSDPNKLWYGNEIEVKDGETYLVCLYLQNDNPDGLNAIAEDVHANIALPTTVGTSHTIVGYIDSSNSTPTRCWDAVTLNSKQDFFIQYVDGSARFINESMGSIDLANDVITSGVPLGYDRFDGKIPGGFNYRSFITIQIETHYSVKSKLSVSARLKGTQTWTKEVHANVGDEIEIRIEFKNFLSDMVNDVMIKDILPKNLEYILQSTLLYNANHQKGVQVVEDTITTSGINIGAYLSKGNAEVRFSAKVVDNNLASGDYQLVNWANVTINQEVTGKGNVSIFLHK